MASHRVLIVEDDTLLLKLYQTKLELAGFVVGTATNGLLGFEQAKEFRPELILLDILMPKVDGYQMLKMMRQHPPTKYIPVMILTNTPSLPDARECQNLGIVKGFFKADITPSQLVNYLEDYFATKQST